MKIIKFIDRIAKWLPFVILLFLISNCGIYKPVDARKVPPNDEERIKINQEEGRGFTLGGIGKTLGTGGAFQFSSSNEMWRATLEILDFIPLSDVDYGGGIIITEWYSAPKKPDESLKIMIHFLTNEIRSDAIDLKIFYKICKTDNNCSINERTSNLVNELKKEILKQAAIYKETSKNKNFKPYSVNKKKD